MRNFITHKATTFLFYWKIKIHVNVNKTWVAQMGPNHLQNEAITGHRVWGNLQDDNNKNIKYHKYRTSAVLI